MCYSRDQNLVLRHMHLFYTYSYTSIEHSIIRHLYECDDVKNN